MKNLRNATALFVFALLISSTMSSCGSAHYGCPGQDRPSFRGGYGMTFPNAEQKQLLINNKTENLDQIQINQLG